MITLVLGGARSGKSAVAERLAAEAQSPVTYLATGVATDADMAARIAAHRARRPADWKTVEVDDDGDLAGSLRITRGTVLVDSMGTWVARRSRHDDADLCDALVARDGDSIVVSDEVGMSVHPLTDSGRRFVDDVGALNQAVAAVADDVLLTIAGRVLPLASAGEA